MKLFQRIFEPTLPIAWELTPGAIIWKMLPTPAGRLVGESRDPDRRTLTLFSIDTRSGVTLFRDRALEEPWWIALEMTIGEVGILQRFPRPDLPRAQGAVAVDAASGLTLWEHPGARLLCGGNGQALAELHDDRAGISLAIVDVRNGAVIEDLGDDLERATAFQEACDEEAIWREWISATPLTGNDSRLGGLGDHIGRYVANPLGAPFMAECGAYRVITVQQRGRTADAALANLVDTILLVFHGDRLLHRERVSRSAPIAGEEIFFIWNRELIYVRDRQTLVGLPLIKR